MPTGYILSPEAQQDLSEIRAFYLQEAGAKVAQYVIREIAHALRFLATTPGAGHIRQDLTLEPVKFWPVFSYLIVYDPSMEPLGVARILHGNQDLQTMFRAIPPHG